MRRVDDGSGLPAAVRRAAAALRRREPSGRFQQRLEQALLRGDDEGASSNRPAPRRRIWLGVSLATSAAVMLATTLHVSREPSWEAIDVLHRTEQLELALGGDGPTWFPLTLETEHHDGERAEVHVEVPKELQVSTAGRASSNNATECGPRRCVHRFAHSTATSTTPHLRIGVDAPGKYRIYVEHASRAKRVRETFVLAAR